MTPLLGGLLPSYRTHPRMRTIDIPGMRKSLETILAWDIVRDGEVPSQKELSSYFEELLVVKFLVKRNLVPQMRNFSPTLDIDRAVACHTDPIESGGEAKALIRRAWAWVLD